MTMLTVSYAILNIGHRMQLLKVANHRYYIKRLTSLFKLSLLQRITLYVDKVSRYCTSTQVLVSDYSN